MVNELKNQKFQNMYCLKMSSFQQYFKRPIKLHEIREENDQANGIPMSFTKRLEDKGKKGIQGRLGSNTQNKKISTFQPGTQKKSMTSTGLIGVGQLSTMSD